MGRHRTPEEKEAFRAEAIAMRRAGIGAKRIARELGVGNALVTELLRGEPVPSSLERPRAKDELREVAIGLRRSGRTYDEIREELGVSKSSLSLWLRDLDFPTDEQRVALREGATDGAELADLGSRAEVARELRRDGWLLREIAEEFRVSMKTVHGWCKGLPVPPRAVHGRTAEEMRSMVRAQWDIKLAARDLERQQAMEASARLVGTLTERELDLVAVTAYWCEGQKSKPWAVRERLAFINSDPELIRIWVEWLRRRGVPREQCRINLSIHESADVEAATAFWAGVLGCSTASFARPSLKRHNPSTVRKNTGDGYVGCLVIATRQSRVLYQHLAGFWRGIARGVTSGDAAD